MATLVLGAGVRSHGGWVHRGFDQMAWTNNGLFYIQRNDKLAKVHL